MGTSTSFTHLPDVLIDPVELSIWAMFTEGEAQDSDVFFERIKEAGNVSSFNWYGLKATFNFSPFKGVRLRCEVRPSFYGDQMSSLSAKISMNAMEMLRADLSNVDQTLKGLDNKKNLVGHVQGRERQLLARQLACVKRAMDAFLKLIDSALPEGLHHIEEKLTLTSCEATLDVTMPNAIALTRALGRAPLNGAINHDDGAYCRNNGDRAGLPVVRYWLKNKGPAYKAYAKLVDLLRLEISCLNHKTVKSLVPQGADRTNEITASEAADLVLAFARAAEPELAKLRDHANAVRQGSAPLTELINAIQPLLDFASGKRIGAGRPANDKTKAAAQAAFNALLYSGKIVLSTIGRIPSLRECLNDLCANDGPLIREGYHAIYVLNPKYANALCSLQGALGGANNP